MPVIFVYPKFLENQGVRDKSKLSGTVFGEKIPETHGRDPQGISGVVILPTEVMHY